jgi:hypothetical protein
MTQPSSARPVPGPPRPADPAPDQAGQDPFTGLDLRPVDEHVAVFESEHDRLQRRLGGIDQV